MKVRDLMTVPVKTCRTTALLGDAAQVMLDAGCGCVPIVDWRCRLAGMLTNRDICLAVAARHQSPSVMPVRDVMSPNIVSVSIDEDVSAALVAMKEFRVRRVPIVDDDGHVKGLISIDDAIRNTGIGAGRLPADAVADVLRHICTPSSRKSSERPEPRARHARGSSRPSSRRTSRRGATWRT